MAKDTPFRSAYQPRKPHTKSFNKPSVAKQEFATECDINNIMKRFERDGIEIHVNRYQGAYGDFTGAVDFHTAMNQVITSQDMFMSLPAEIRERFGNDPGAFLDFVTDPVNEDELIEMGLRPPKSGRNVPDPIDPLAEPQDGEAVDGSGGTGKDKSESTD